MLPTSVYIVGKSVVWTDTSQKGAAMSALNVASADNWQWPAGSIPAVATTQWQWLTQLFGVQLLPVRLGF